MRIRGADEGPLRIQQRTPCTNRKIYLAIKGSDEGTSINTTFKEPLIYFLIHKIHLRDKGNVGDADSVLLALKAKMYLVD